MENTKNTTDIDAVTENNKTEGIMFAMIAYVTGLFIFCANVLVIRAVVITDVLQTRANMYIVSLASTDALVGVLLWIVGTNYLPSATRWFGSTEFACVGMLSLCYVAAMCSALNMCLVAFDRYYCIVWPLQYQRLVTERKVKIAIACAWIAAVIIGGLPLFFNTFDTARVCTLRYVIPVAFKSYFVVSFYVVCCSVIFVVYAKLGWLSYQTMKTISQARAHLGQTALAGAGPQTTPTSPHQRPSRSSLKGLKMFVTVFGFLVACWSPYFIAEIVSDFKTLNTFPDMFLVLGFFNSGINAFIYPYFNKDFRVAMKKMLCCERIMCCMRFRNWIEIGCTRGCAKRDGRVANAAVLPVRVRHDNITNIIVIPHNASE